MLPKKFFLTLDALVYIAAAEGNRTIGTKELNQYLNVPDRYLEPILQGLVRVGVLKGTRGPRGGYVLGKERRKISMVEIYQVVEALHKESKRDGAAYHDYLHPFRKELYSKIELLLQEYTLDGLMIEYRQQEGGKANLSTDFAI